MQVSISVPRRPSSCSHRSFNWAPGSYKSSSRLSRALIGISSLDYMVRVGPALCVSQASLRDYFSLQVACMGRTLKDKARTGGWLDRGYGSIGGRSKSFAGNEEAHAPGPLYVTLIGVRCRLGALAWSLLSWASVFIAARYLRWVLS